MKQLVVLVGLPGSGKTVYQREHSDWMVVSRSSIRQTMFRCSYDPAVEETVDRIFHAALVEALDSSVDVVCIDEPNLTSAERAPLVELAKLAGRASVACVMSDASGDAAYERMQRNLRRMALEAPHVRVASFSRKAYDALVAGYEPVTAQEGFDAVEHTSARVPVIAGTKTARPRPEREPLPLFTA